MSIIQQLEDLKEWSQDSTRYERRLAFRNRLSSLDPPIGGTIPPEWDELSDREQEYYRKGPWSTRPEYQKGQLVQPGPGRQGYKGNPLLGTKYTGTQQKGRIFGKNQERLDKLKEIIQDSNNNYKKTLTSREALIKAGWKDGYQSLGTTQKIRPEVAKAMKKLTTTAEKMDNYVNNVMLAENALVQDFRAPQQHLAKKFGVSKGFMDRWAATSKVYSQNKRLFNNLAKNLSFNKYKLLPDGTPRLMSEFSVLVQNKLPTNQGWFSGSAEIRTILDSAKRNYLQNKALGKDAKVRFITDPTLTSINDWQFIDNETGRLFSVDPQIDTVEFEGKTYKNNYLNHRDARKLYDKEFGNIYRMYDEDLAKYLDAEIIGKNGKPIKLDRSLQEQAYKETGKKTYMERRMMEIDHMDLLDDPFGRKKGSLRLLERRINQRAGLYKQIYKNDPKLLASKLDEIGYNKKFNNTDELIEFYSKKTVPKATKLQPSYGLSSNLAGVLDDALKTKTAKKVGSFLTKTGAPFEAGFIVTDYYNNLSRGMKPEEAWQTALSNATFGIYEGGGRSREKELAELAKTQGYKDWQVDSLKTMMSYNKLEKELQSEKFKLKQLIAEQESGVTSVTGEDVAGAIEQQKDLISKMEQGLEDTGKTYYEGIPEGEEEYNTGKMFDDLLNSKAREEYNKTVEERKHRVNPDMGEIGSPLWEALSDWKTYLPQNLMETTQATQPVVRNLRKLPGILGEMWDPTSEQAMLSAMTPEEREERALRLNVKRQTYDPMHQTSTMTYDQMDPYYADFGYMYGEGGIAGLLKK